MTDWIEHTTDTCPVDPDTVVEVRLRGGYVRPADKAGDMDWGSFWVASFRPPLGSPIQHPLDVTHYRIITPAPTPLLFLGGDPVKPPELEMTEWIEHTTGRCPVDPETVVEVLLPGHTQPSPPRLATLANWRKGAVAYYRIITPAKPPEPEGKEIDPRGTQMWIKQQPDRIITPAPTPLLFLGGDPVKPPELEMTKTAQEHAAAMFATATKPEPDLITLRLECLKLAVNDHFYEAGEPDYERVADRLLHYVLKGSVDKA
jgi:hypothetical protein